VSKMQLWEGGKRTAEEKNRMNDRKKYAKEDRQDKTFIKEEDKAVGGVQKRSPVEESGEVSEKKRLG